MPLDEFVSGRLVGEVALDGRRVQGDSAVDQNRTREQIEAEIEEILEEAAEIDELEDEEYGPENRGDELPEELEDKEDRLDRLREAKAHLDEQEQARKDEQIEKIHERAREERETGETRPGRKPTPPEDVELDPDAKANVTDPESSLMKPYDTWIQGYNGQTAVDCATQIIVAEDVTTDPNDKQQLEPMLEECEETNDEPPETVIADAGYASKANFRLGDEQTELFIATTKSWKRRKEHPGKGSTAGTNSRFVWANTANGTETPDQAWPAHLCQACSHCRVGLWPARQSRL